MNENTYNSQNLLFEFLSTCLRQFRNKVELFATIGICDAYLMQQDIELIIKIHTNLHNNLQKIRNIINLHQNKQKIIQRFLSRIQEIVLINLYKPSLLPNQQFHVYFKKIQNSVFNFTKINNFNLTLIEILESWPKSYQNIIIKNIQQNSIPKIDKILTNNSQNNSNSILQNEKPLDTFYRVIKPYSCLEYDLSQLRSIYFNTRQKKKSIKISQYISKCKYRNRHIQSLIDQYSQCYMKYSQKKQNQQIKPRQISTAVDGRISKRTLNNNHNKKVVKSQRNLPDQSFSNQKFKTYKQQIFDLKRIKNKYETISYSQQYKNETLKEQLQNQKYKVRNNIVSLKKVVINGFLDNFPQNQQIKNKRKAFYYRAYDNHNRKKPYNMKKKNNSIVIIKNQSINYQQQKFILGVIGQQQKF